MGNFTDAYTCGQTIADRVTTSAKSLAEMFWTWPGTLYLCHGRQRAIRSLVDAMRLPYEEIRVGLALDFFSSCTLQKLSPPPSERHCRHALFGVLSGGTKKYHRIEQCSQFRASYVESTDRAGRRLNQPLSNIALAASDQNEDVSNFKLWTSDHQNLLEHHIALILMVFIKAGLFEVSWLGSGKTICVIKRCTFSQALVEIIEDQNKAVVIKATVLLGELLDLTCRLLPASYNINTQVGQKF